MTERAGVAYVHQDPDMPGVSDVFIHDEETNAELAKYAIPYGMRLAVATGTHVQVGQSLTEGSKAPADIMRIQGLDEVYAYLIKEVQKVYRSQSCNVNDKHIEIIARQMTRKIRIEEPGDTTLLPGTIVDRNELEEINTRTLAQGEAQGLELKPASGTPILLGITKAALQSGVLPVRRLLPGDDQGAG